MPKSQKKFVNIFYLTEECKVGEFQFEKSERIRVQAVLKVTRRGKQSDTYEEAQ